MIIGNALEVIVMIILYDIRLENPHCCGRVVDILDLRCPYLINAGSYGGLRRCRLGFKIDRAGFLPNIIWDKETDTLVNTGFNIHANFEVMTERPKECIAKYGIG
jgi:hypothetical protein